MSSAGASDAATQDLLDERALSKLKWRCRRGLLENDLIIERFFKRHGNSITVDQADAIAALMALADGDLLDLLLKKTEPQNELDTAEVRHVLHQMRLPPSGWDGVNSGNQTSSPLQGNQKNEN